MNKFIITQKKSVVFIATLVTIAGCGGSYSSSGGGYTTSPISTSSVQEVDCTKVVATGIISIQLSTFSPVIETINVNGVVRWTNNDLGPETVTGGMPGVPDGRFDITLAATTSKCLKFTAAGVFNYYSKTTLSMSAQVIVQ